MNILIGGVLIVMKFYPLPINIIMMMFGVRNATDGFRTIINGLKGLILKLVNFYLLTSLK